MTPFGGSKAFSPLLTLLQTGEAIPLLIQITGIISLVLLGFIFFRKDIAIYKSLWKKLLWTYFIILVILFFTQQVPAIFKNGDLGIYDIGNGLILNSFIYLGILLYLLSFKINPFFWRVILITIFITFTLDVSISFLLPYNYLNTHLPFKWSNLVVSSIDSLWFWFLSLPATYTIYQLSKGKVLKSK